MTELKNLTEQEQADLELAKEYMRIACTPGEASADAVAHLCAPGNTFVGPTTFPGTETLEQYADVHGELMTTLDDLHLVSFDMEFMKDDRVAPRRRRPRWQTESAQITTMRYHNHPSLMVRPAAGLDPVPVHVAWRDGERSPVVTEFVRLVQQNA